MTTATGHQKPGGVPRKAGFLTRISNAVYCHLGLALCLALLCGPTLLVLTFLAPSATNTPLFVLAQLPVAPAMAAGLYAVRAWRAGADVAPFALFAKGLQLNTVDVLKWWVPALGVLSVLAVNIGFDVEMPGRAGLQVVNLVLAVMLVLACGHALVISSAFSFRVIDIARLALFLLGQGWRLTLLFISMLIVATAIVVAGSDMVLLVSLWAFVSLLELASRPTLNLIARKFTAHDG